MKVSKEDLYLKKCSIINELSDDGYSKRQIAEIMNVSHTTVYRILEAK